MSKKIDSRQEFINPAIYDGQIQKPTEGELQNEYNYLLAEQLTQSLMRDTAFAFAFPVSPIFLHEGRGKNSELPGFPSFQAVPF